jgi:hypothetical protein
MGRYESRSGKKGEVNPGSLRALIGIRYAKWTPVQAPIRKVSQTGLFCQTDDFIDAPKLGQILRFRKDLEHKVITFGCAAGTRLSAF